MEIAALDRSCIGRKLQRAGSCAIAVIFFGVNVTLWYVAIRLVGWLLSV